MRRFSTLIIARIVAGSRKRRPSDVSSPSADCGLVASGASSPGVSLNGATALDRADASACASSSLSNCSLRSCTCSHACEYGLARTRCTRYTVDVAYQHAVAVAAYINLVHSTLHKPHKEQRDHDDVAETMLQVRKCGLTSAQPWLRNTYTIRNGIDTACACVSSSQCREPMHGFVGSINRQHVWFAELR